MVDEVARLAVSGRVGTEVVQVTALDLADVTSLGVHASDGGSIYRPPNEERYCTLAHLDTEEQILTTEKREAADLDRRVQAGPLANRDTLQITVFRGSDAEVRRQRLDGTWTGRSGFPGVYLAASAELAYAGNVRVAQGRTVDTAHLLVTDSLSRQALYVGMTRGRQANTAHVITGTTAPPGHQPYQQVTPNPSSPAP